MTHKDNRRKWMWLFLGILAALQLYAVRELLAAFAIFVLGFGAIAVSVGLLYFLHKAWEAGVTRVAVSQHPAILAARRGVASAEDWARRPIRRPDSEPAR
jgi:membrane protein implicated in regulation of membrane protease activity